MDNKYKSKRDSRFTWDVGHEALELHKTCQCKGATNVATSIWTKGKIPKLVGKKEVVQVGVTIHSIGVNNLYIFEQGVPYIWYQGYFHF
jgi:hypothetical protein